MNSKVVSGIMPTLLLISMLTLTFNLHAVDAAPQENEHIRVYLDPLTIQDPILMIGTEFSVDFSVDYVENLWAYQFWLKFNPVVLHGVSVENGPFLGSATDPRLHPVQVVPGPGFDNEAGELKLFGAFISFTGTPPHDRYLADGSGVLATVTFEVVGYGSSPITLGAPDTGLTNKTAGHLMHNTETGDWEHCWGTILVQEPGQPPKTVPYEPWLNILSEGSGFFSNEGFPPGLSADLIRRSAWPEHHHYGISKDEDGNQTLYAKVRNLGNQTAWVKAAFNLTRDDGLSTVVETEPLSIETGTIAELSANFGPLTDEDAGTYCASVKCWCSHNKIWWAEGEKEKTFKFTIAP